MVKADNTLGFTVVAHCVPYDKLWPSERERLDCIRQLVHWLIYRRVAATSGVVSVQLFGDRGALLAPDTAKLLRSTRATHPFYQRLHTSRRR